MGAGVQRVPGGSGQQETVDLLKGLGLGEELERCILRDNGLKLLQSV